LMKLIISSFGMNNGADTLTSPLGGCMRRYIFLMFFRSRVMGMFSIKIFSLTINKNKSVLFLNIMHKFDLG